MSGALVIEDEFLIASEIAYELRQRGVTPVHMFRRAQEALELLEHESPSFALLDINIEGGTSEAVARLLRARDIPFVFVSGNELSFLPADLQTSPVFAKPVDWQLLGRWIEVIVGDKPAAS